MSNCGCGKLVVSKGAGGTCGTTGPTTNLSFNISGSPIVCTLPCVPEFSSSLGRFRNQITRQVLNSLSRRCRTQVQLPQGALIQLAVFTEELTIPILVTLEVEALSVDSVSINLQNVRFEVIGFASVIVRITGEVVVTIQYTGVDNLPHTQQEVVPFTEQVTLPGNYPANVIADGTLALDNVVVSENIDPSLLTIASVDITAFFVATIRLVVPV